MSAYLALATIEAAIGAMGALLWALSAARARRLDR